MEIENFKIYFMYIVTGLDNGATSEDCESLNMIYVVNEKEFYLLTLLKNKY